MDDFPAHRRGSASSASSVSTPDSVRSNKRRSVESRTSASRNNLSNSLSLSSSQLGLGHHNGLQLGHNPSTLSPFSQSGFRKRTASTTSDASAGNSLHSPSRKPERPRSSHSFPTFDQSEASDSPSPSRPSSSRVGNKVNRLRRSTNSRESGILDNKDSTNENKSPKLVRQGPNSSPMRSSPSRPQRTPIKVEPADAMSSGDESSSSFDSLSSDRPIPTSTFTSPLDMSVKDQASFRQILANRSPPVFKHSHSKSAADAQSRPRRESKSHGHTLSSPSAAKIPVRELTLKDVMPEMAPTIDATRSALDIFEAMPDDHSQSDDSDASQWLEDRFRETWNFFLEDVCHGKVPGHDVFDFDVKKAFIESIGLMVKSPVKEHFDQVKFPVLEKWSAENEVLERGSAQHLHEMLLRHTLQQSNNDWPLRMQMIEPEVVNALQQLVVPVSPYLSSRASESEEPDDILDSYYTPQALDKSEKASDYLTALSLHSTPRKQSAPSGIPRPSPTVNSPRKRSSSTYEAPSLFIVPAGQRPHYFSSEPSRDEGLGSSPPDVESPLIGQGGFLSYDSPTSPGTTSSFDPLTPIRKSRKSSAFLRSASYRHRESITASPHAPTGDEGSYSSQSDSRTIEEHVAARSAGERQRGRTEARLELNAELVKKDKEIVEAKARFLEEKKTLGDVIERKEAQLAAIQDTIRYRENYIEEVESKLRLARDTLKAAEKKIEESKRVEEEAISELKNQEEEIATKGKEIKHMQDELETAVANRDLMDNELKVYRKQVEDLLNDIASKNAKIKQIEHFEGLTTRLELELSQKIADIEKLRAVNEQLETRSLDQSFHGMLSFHEDMHHGELPKSSSLGDELLAQGALLDDQSSFDMSQSDDEGSVNGSISDSALPAYADLRLDPVYVSEGTNTALYTSVDRGEHVIMELLPRQSPEQHLSMFIGTGLHIEPELDAASDFHTQSTATPTSVAQIANYFSPFRRRSVSRSSSTRSSQSQRSARSSPARLSIFDVIGISADPEEFTEESAPFSDRDVLVGNMVETQPLSPLIDVSVESTDQAIQTDLPITTEMGTGTDDFSMVETTTQSTQTNKLSMVNRSSGTELDFGRAQMTEQFTQTIMPKLQTKSTLTETHVPEVVEQLEQATQTAYFSVNRGTSTDMVIENLKGTKSPDLTSPAPPKTFTTRLVSTMLLRNRSQNMITNVIFHLLMAWLFVLGLFLTREVLIWREANSIVTSTLAAVLSGGEGTDPLFNVMMGGLPEWSRRIAFSIVQSWGAEYRPIV